MVFIPTIEISYRPFLSGSHPPDDEMLKNKDIEPWMDGSIQIEFNKDVHVNKIIDNDSDNDTYFLTLLLATVIHSDDVPDSSSRRTIVFGVVYLIWFYSLCCSIYYASD
jgi:hypothetical protein